MRGLASTLIRKLTGSGAAWLRAIAEQIDVGTERLWEFCARVGHRQPSHGEMTAIIRRMGGSGFTAYVTAQHLGHYGPRGFLPADRHAVTTTLRGMYPQEAAAVIATAERLAAGRFDILGSGVIDMRRGGAGPGWRIDWPRDPISGQSYARGFSHLRWNPATFRSGQSDVKGPWELTRCQHFVTLGLAYWLTGDERYAECYARTITDFIRRNPPRFGVHWACPMDASLRVVGWLTGLGFFQGSPHLSLLWWRRFLKSLVEHGRHIAANLEYGTLNGKIILSNHGIADFLGLYWLSSCFPQLDAGCNWRGIAETALEQQIRIQTHADGGNFESSVPYHRLTAEMFMSAYALSVKTGQRFSDGYRNALLRQLLFVRALRQPGGRWPQIGDADNGRAHIFTGYCRWQQESLDHLLAAGAKLLGQPDLAEGLPADVLAEAMFWPADGLPAGSLPDPGNPVVLPDFGVAVLRGAETYVSFGNSICGTQGFGNHKHNDNLAIEWVVGDQPILVDGGSYTYTQDPDARNRFRSVNIHNTVSVAGQEQHGMNPAWLFRMEQAGEVGLSASPAAPGWIAVEGWHTAYMRLAPPVRHSRRVSLRQRDGAVLIEDRLTGGRGHPLRWHFLLHPSVTATIGPDGSVQLSAPQVAGMIESGLPWQIREGEYSRGYGHREATRSLVAELPAGAEFVRIVLYPAAEMPADLAAIQEEASA